MPRTWKAYAVLAGLAGLLLLGYHLREVFTPVLVAFALAYLLNPAVSWLERLRLPRAGAIAALYGLGAAALLGAAAFTAPLIARESSNLYRMTFTGDGYADLNDNGQRDPGEPVTRDVNGNGAWDRSYADRVRDFGRVAVSRWNRRHPDQAIHVDDLILKVRAKLEGNLGQVAGGVADVLDRAVTVVVSGVRGLMLAVSYLVLVPIYLFVILQHFERFRPAVLGLCPVPERDRFGRVLRRLDGAIAGFFRGQIVCSACKGLIVALGLAIVGTPYGFLLGLLYGALSVVPYVGVLVAFPLIEIVTVVDAGGIPVGMVVGALAVVGIAELVEGLILVPVVFGGETGLHPVVLLLSLFVFGELFGFFGMLAAVPLAAATKILVEEYLLPTVREVVDGTPSGPSPTMSTATGPSGSPADTRGA